MDCAGQPRPDADKDIIQQVRHLWTFSCIHRFEDCSPAIQDSIIDVDNGCAWMSFAWKSSYHSLRALITRKLWIEERCQIGRSR